jgi:hypothetical protein
MFMTRSEFQQFFNVLAVVVFVVLFSFLVSLERRVLVLEKRVLDLEVLLETEEQLFEFFQQDGGGGEIDAAWVVHMLLSDPTAEKLGSGNRTRLTSVSCERWGRAVAAWTC